MNDDDGIDEMSALDREKLKA